MSHWARQYIGDPWEADGHDCWGFFRRVQKEQFGRAVPVVDVDALDLRAVIHALDNHPEHRHWRPVDRPVEGDAVLLSRSRHPSHVGVWIEADGGGVLHCQQGAGVVFTPAGRLVSEGWGRVAYYRFQGESGR